MAHSSGLMEHRILGHFKMVLLLVREYFYLLTNLHIVANSKIIMLMEKGALRWELITLNRKEIGLMDAYLGTENNFIQMDLFIMESLRMGKNMDMEFIIFLTATCMMVNGCKT